MDMGSSTEEYNGGVIRCPRVGANGGGRYGLEVAPT